MTFFPSFVPGAAEAALLAAPGPPPRDATRVLRAPLGGCNQGGASGTGKGEAPASNMSAARALKMQLFGPKLFGPKLFGPKLFGPKETFRTGSAEGRAAGTARGAEPAGTEAKDCGEENAHGPSGIAGQAGARERPSGDEPAVDWAAGAAADEAVPHLVLLGTGAAAPSRLRSCSGVLLSVPCGEGGASRGGSAPWARLPCMALLDCGEGCIARLTHLAEHYARQRSGAQTAAPCAEGAWHTLLLQIRTVDRWPRACPHGPSP